MKLRFDGAGKVLKHIVNCTIRQAWRVVRMTIDRGSILIWWMSLIAVRRATEMVVPCGGETSGASESRP